MTKCQMMSCINLRFVQENTPKYYRRYVEDIFLLFDNKDNVKTFLRYMNSSNRNINFIFEDQRENKLSFVDVTITRMNKKLVTSLIVTQHLVVYI